MKIAIYGYGNLGRGVECALRQAPDMECVGVFTRRPPESVQTIFDTPVYHVDDLNAHKENIDVVIICGGSATDLPKMTPALAKEYNVVDSFDTHAAIPAHFAAVDAAAKEGGTVALISGGWDPGMFSLNRLYAEAVLPNGKDYTFWGKGVSQGHSDAIRRIEGVLDARQYTVPIDAAMQKVKNGEMPTFTAGDMHERICYVAIAPDADAKAIEQAIVTMPNYFADYDTTVNFVTLEELQKNHSSLPHGGSVIRTGTTGLHQENKHCIEYSLKLDSNPEFTASILLACARAANRMYARGDVGCKTLFDIAPADLSPFSPEELRKRML